MWSVRGSRRAASIQPPRVYCEQLGAKVIIVAALGAMPTLASPPLHYDVSAVALYPRAVVDVPRRSGLRRAGAASAARIAIVAHFVVAGLAASKPARLRAGKGSLACWILCGLAILAGPGAWWGWRWTWWRGGRRRTWRHIMSDGNIGATVPDLVGLLTVPTPAQNILAWCVWDLDLINDAEGIGTANQEAFALRGPSSIKHRPMWASWGWWAMLCIRCQVNITPHM